MKTGHNGLGTSLNRIANIGQTGRLSRRVKLPNVGARWKRPSTSYNHGGLDCLIFADLFDGLQKTLAHRDAESIHRWVAHLDDRNAVAYSHLHDFAHLPLRLCRPCG